MVNVQKGPKLRKKGSAFREPMFSKLSPRTSQRSPLRPKEEPLKGPVQVWRGPKGLPGKRKEFEGSKQLQLGGIDGISCQHLQVLMGATPAETFWSGSMDTKTAYDVARPKHSAQIMGDQDVPGWITAALLREMSGVASHEMHPSRERPSPSGLAQTGNADLVEC